MLILGRMHVKFACVHVTFILVRAICYFIATCSSIVWWRDFWGQNQAVPANKPTRGGARQGPTHITDSANPCEELSFWVDLSLSIYIYMYIAYMLFKSSCECVRR